MSGFRFAGIKTPEDFVNSRAGMDLMDSICMVLLATGEEFKKIDNETEGGLLAQYPQIAWRGAIGLRDVLAHGYFKSIRNSFTPSAKNIPPLIETVKRMIQDLDEAESAP
ncbi:MAG: HepT-like ribonuclease domain-containing protein [Caldilineaceae bacterium]